MTKDLQVVSMKRKDRARRRKTARRATKADLYREWGIPEYLIARGFSPRYSGLRGILWYWFSIYIRTRDLKKYGTCIGCLRQLESIEEGHGGHFIPTGSASWDGFVFDETNVHLECPNCNKRDKVKLNYGIHLDERYGEGTAENLRNRYKEYKKYTHKNYGQQEYRERIAHFKSLLQSLNETSS